jgi:hypothetical protein
MNRLVSSGCFVLGVGMMVTAVAVAQSGPHNSPGYKYGRENCGPNQKPCIPTRRDCEACCQAGARNNSIRSENLQHCYDYCASVPWLPCDQRGF